LLFVDLQTMSDKINEDIKYKVLFKPNREIEELVQNTVFGTSGIRMQHKNAIKKIKELHSPEFHTLWENDRLIALSTYCKRKFKVKDIEQTGYYIRYFSVHPHYQNRGIGQLLTRKIENYYKKELTRSTIFYAHIEEKNLKSLGVSKHFNQKVIGTIKPLFFSRFFTKKNKNCWVVKEEELEEAKTILQNHYTQTYATWLYRIGYENGCMVYKAQGKIVAILQANKIEWKINSFPGLVGWLSLHILPYIPILGRVGGIKHFDFVGFEGLYCKKGFEKELIQLMEYALYQKKVNRGLVYLDTKDTLYQRLKKQNLGIFNRLNNPPTISVLRNTYKTSEREENIAFELPIYTSSYDVS